MRTICIAFIAVFAVGVIYGQETTENVWHALPILNSTMSS